MAGKPLPGHPGVTVYKTWQEAQADGKIDKVEQGADGNLYATPHQGWLLNHMPELVIGTMAGGQLGYATGLFGGAAPAAGEAIPGVEGLSAIAPYTAAADAAPAGFIEGAGAAGLPAVGKAKSVWDDIGGSLTDVGQTLSGAAEGSASQRLTEYDRQLSRDRNELVRNQQVIQAPATRTKQVAAGDALQNVQDVDWNYQPQSGPLPPVSYTGGLRPSMLGDNARQAGGELSRQALMHLMNQDDVPPLAPMTQETGGEKAMAGVGLGANIGGLIWDQISNRLRPR